MNKKLYQLLIAFLILGTTACQNTKQTNNAQFEVLASSVKQWTGVAVSHEGRVFVNYPKWSDDVPVSVAEIIDGKAIAYPTLNGIAETIMIHLLPFNL